MTRTYVVPKMMCNGCVRNISNKLMKVEGITYTINLEDKRVVVDFLGDVEDSKVISAIKSAGYDSHRL